MKNGDISYGYTISLKILYILSILYIASITIFAKLDNVYMGNIIFLAMAGYLILHEFIYSSQTYYFNKELNIYFLFLIFSTLSIFWSISPDATIEITRRIFMVFVSLIIIYNIIKKYDFLSVLFYGMLIVVMINFLILHKIIPVTYETYFPSTERFIGTTENPNITAGRMFIAIFISVIYLYKQTNVYKILLGYLNVVIAYYMIVMTISRTSLVVSLGLVFLLALNTIMHPVKRKYFFLTLIFGGFIFVYFVDMTLFIKTVEFAIERIGFIFQSLLGHGVEHSADERLELALGAINTFKENPLFGTGMDTVSYYMGLYAHNNYAELLADSGLIGTIIFYTIYISSIYKVFQIEDRWLKAYLLMFIFSLLTYDLGGVTYFDKLTLTAILAVAFIAEKEYERKLAT
jgi:O-antigen ligase